MNEIPRARDVRKQIMTTKNKRSAKGIGKYWVHSAPSISPEMLGPKLHTRVGEEGGGSAGFGLSVAVYYKTNYPNG